MGVVQHFECLTRRVVRSQSERSTGSDQLVRSFRIKADIKGHRIAVLGGDVVSEWLNHQWRVCYCVSYMQASLCKTMMTIE